ncbi:hypothetical protein C8R41DRAFT_927127 [Lentinula lateritia]|uniref:Uncharacterized protein n=1 Tax=Lentinula lateritia TaxID=40482 RepID=A0ABQ8UWP9_9AGAR|nr:hypothetical protein C8R41DRAFT_927127 [Lentinula lateritia]
MTEDDLGPRLLTSIVGYGGAVYSFRHQYWLWGGILAPILGGVTVASFYNLLFINSGWFRNVLDRKEAAVRNGNGKSAQASVLSLTSNITPIMMHYLQIFHLRHATLLLLLIRWNKPNAKQLEKSYASATYPIHSQLISL